MSDSQFTDWDGLSRRDALWYLLGTPISLGLLSSSLEAQIAAPRNLRIAGGKDYSSYRPPADSPLGQGLHPRTFLTPQMAASLRTQISNDGQFRARWQQAVSQFEEKGGYWDQGSTNQFTLSFAAFLAAVRRPGNDLGLTWRSSWQNYRDRVVTGALSWGFTGSSGTISLAHGIVYDLLYHDLTEAERTELHGRMIQLLDVKTRLKWQSAGGHWDDQTSDEHLARVVLSLAADDGATRAGKALQESIDYAHSHEAMQYGEGVGYAWKDEAIANITPALSLWILKNALSLSDAESLDNCLISFRDTWQHVRQFTIPHPGYGSITQWRQARVNFQAPFVPNYHRGANVGANMLWALAILPGKVDLSNDGTLTNQPTLARDEAAYFGYMQHILDQVPVGKDVGRVLSETVLNFKWVYSGSTAGEKGHMQTFLAFPPWLVMNVQPRPAMSPEAAGIPRVRRWWPGTLNWVTIIGGAWESGADQSLIAYSHRRWYSNAYTAGCMQNGMWQVHRGGPLLIKRGSTSHGPVGKRTWAGNGTVGFYDLNNPEFMLAKDLDEDRGEIRSSKQTHDHYDDMLRDPGADFGRITAWHADDKVVAITSDLTRSYNSTTVAVNGAPKISAFTREFVCVQRGADGTDHERIFTYDRIAALGNGRYQPRYNLCPATDPNIDGSEVPFTPWYPEPAGQSLSEPRGGTYKTRGPVRWDYEGATRLVYDSSTQDVPRGGDARGNGKVCVTWLEPSGANVAVRKRGGTNMYWDPAVKDQDGSPSFGPWGELYGKDGAWNDVNTPDEWMFAGIYTVQVMAKQFNPDTRFLMACDVMHSKDTPSPAQSLPCDPGSAAARCGASVVVFSKAAAGHSAGSVTIPAGVSLVVLANLPPGVARTISASGGLTVTTPNRTASAGNADAAGANEHGRLVLGVSGSGTLAFS